MEAEKFQIVKYIKGKNNEYEVVPSSWVIGTKCYFPLNNMKTMIQDPHTKPDVSSWLSYQMIRIKRAGFANYKDAVNALDILLEDTTTDTDTHINDLKTRSKKHNVSHAANRMFQLQLPSVLEEVASNVPLQQSSPPAEDAPNTGGGKYQCVNFLDHNEQGSSTNAEEDVNSLQYIVLDDFYTNERSPEASNAVVTEMQEEIAFSPGEKFIIGQLKQITTKLMDLTNAVNLVMTSMESNEQKIQLSTSSVSKILGTEKLIRDEVGLKYFEEQSDEWRNQLRLELLVKMGKRNPTEVRSCCLELCDVLICHEFWQLTSWAGGTKNEAKPKFALQEHRVFLNFFKDLVRETTEACFSDKDFACFFQSKMKNRNQLPTGSKRAASRNRAN